MSQTKTLNGTNYTLPTNLETGWGSQTSSWMSAISDMVNATISYLSSKVHLTATRLASPFQWITATTPATTVDLSGGYNIALTLSSTTTLTLLNPRDGERYVFYVRQTGGYNIVWPVAVKWPSGSPPLISLSPGSKDVICLMYNSTDGIYLGEFAKNYF